MSQTSTAPAGEPTPPPGPTPPPEPTPPPGPTPPREAKHDGPSTRTVLLVAAAIVVTIVIVLAAGTALVRLRDGGTDQDGSGRDAAGRANGHGEDQRRTSHVASGPTSGRTRAVLDVVSGAAAVTVRGGDLGDRLYRVSTPDDASIAPSAVDTGEGVQIHLSDTGQSGPSAVEIQLNRAVRWELRFTVGAASNSIDMRDTAVSGVTFIGGVASIDLSLGRPTGTVAVRMSGGASQFGIHLPDGVPVRVRAGGGAGSVTIDGQTRGGLAGGAVVTSSGWDSAGDRYDVDNTVGVGSVIVDRR